MGFRFRKSAKMGPVRVNFSKSGVGYSVGGKGFRYTKKANGGSRTTTSIPGTGISYTKDYPKKASSTKAKSGAKTSAKSGTSNGKSGGCLTAILWFVGICLVIGLIKEYWKILLTLALVVVAAYIAYKIYRKKNPKAAPDDDDDANAIEDPPSVPECEDLPKLESEVKTYEVAGVNYYLDSLLSMMVPNYLYKYKKQELIDICKTDEPIYKETIEEGTLEITPEPENPHDPNAIKVLINGKLVGYIAAKDCKHLLEVIESDKVVSIAYKISGGKYKMVNEDYDIMKDKSTYTMETGEDSYGITLYIREKI